MKGKLPYRDFETFYGPPNPFLLAVVYHIGGIGLTPERATGFAYRLIFLGAMFCLARRWNSTVASGCTLFAALFLVSLGVAAYAWTGRLACALCSIYLLAQAESRQCGRGRCQWRASLPCGFWSRRNVVSITGFLAIPRREKLWYLFGAAAGLFPLGCLVLVIGPRRYWKTYSSFLFCNPAPAVISVRSCGKAGSHSFLRTSDRVLDQPSGGMASNTG